MSQFPPIQSSTLSHINNVISSSFQKRKRMDTLNQRRHSSTNMQTKEDFKLFLGVKYEFKSFIESKDDFNSHIEAKKDDFKIDPLMIIHKIREILMAPLPNVKKHRDLKNLLQAYVRKNHEFFLQEQRINEITKKFEDIE